MEHKTTIFLQVTSRCRYSAGLHKYNKQNLARTVGFQTFQKQVPMNKCNHNLPNEPSIQSLH